MCWLFVDAESDCGWSEVLAEALTELGADVEKCSTEEAVTRLSSITLEGVGDGELTPMPAFVFYLPSSISASVNEESHLDVFARPWWRCLFNALALAQAVCSRHDASNTRLWFLTPHALRVEAGDSPTSASLQALWGLGRTLSLEHPHTFSGLLDLPLTPSETDSLAAIVALLLQRTPPCEGDEFALRQDTIWTRRLARVPVPDAVKQAAPWRPVGTCIITGGTGALGIHLPTRKIMRRCSGTLMITRASRM